MSKKALYAGQVGYVVLNIRSVKETFIGDTFHRPKETVESLPGFKRAKQMVFLIPFSPWIAFIVICRFLLVYILPSLRSMSYYGTHWRN